MEQDTIHPKENLLTLPVTLIIAVILISILIYTLMTIKTTKHAKFNTDPSFVYNTDCPICFNASKKAIKSDCGHAFCLNCLYTYLKKSRASDVCPLCRTPLSNLTPIENPCDTWPKTDLRKMKTITSNKKSTFFKLHENGPTIYTYFFCVLFLILWMCAVSGVKFEQSNIHRRLRK